MPKNFLRNLIFREKASSEKYIAWLKKKGVTVGAFVTVYAPRSGYIDVTCPWLLTIGDHVKITQGVIILTHDYSWSVLRQLPNHKGIILGAQSPVTIGNNVFIGMNAIITRGVTIGDNVIIGACSVVTKHCDSGFVYAGVPAEKIMTVEEYYRKREKSQFDDARKMALLYRERFGKKPPKEVFREYFMLFCTAEEAMQIPEFQSQMNLSGSVAASEEYLQKTKPMFQDYTEFLDACYGKDGSKSHSV